MKRLKVTVNGQVYDVMVEENNSNSPVAAPAPVQATTPVAPAPVSPEPVSPKPQQEPAKVEKPVVSGECKELIKSPMPGTIMSVEVTPGQQVKKGDNLLILEAMKMENEIVSPIDATVGAVMVEKGDTVDSGSELITLI